MTPNVPDEPDFDSHKSQKLDTGPVRSSGLRRAKRGLGPKSTVRTVVQQPDFYSEHFCASSHPYARVLIRSWALNGGFCFSDTGQYRRFLELRQAYFGGACPEVRQSSSYVPVHSRQACAKKACCLIGRTATRKKSGRSTSRRDTGRQPWQRQTRD